MKRFAPSLLLLLLSLALTSPSFAQEIAANAVNASLPFVTTAATHTTEAASPIMANPDAKLTGKLTNLFPQSARQQWRQVPNGYYVTFLNNDRKASAMFSSKGVLQYAITDCGLEQLPEQLRTTIAQNYQGYKLLNAVEIAAHKSVAHQAILENEAGYITLKATTDQIEEIARKTKSK